MSAPCSDSFRELAAHLGGISCDKAAPAITLRSPTSLENWTLPVVEALMIGGALLALAHALWRRRHGDRSLLALWAAAVVYVLVLEPPLYFPQQLGIDGYLDVTFVHNVFSVEFLYDRMPLYIVTLYPAGIYLAYTLVELFGVFEARGRLVGAICAGFVHHSFYEIFDNLGPQLRWWAWNPDVAFNRPMLGSVPLVSVVLFALVGPALLIFVWRWLVAEPDARARLSPASLAGRTIAVGVATPLLLPVAGAPVAYLVLADHPNRTVMAILLYGVVVAAAIVALPALARARPAARPQPASPADRYPLVHGLLYLGVFAVLWATALPDALGATHGRTPQGTPVGNPLYVLACAAVCTWILYRARRVIRPREPSGAPALGSVVSPG